MKDHIASIDPDFASDAIIELSDPNSRTTKYFKNMRLLATALANVGGMTQEKTDIINSYIGSLGTRALDFFFREFQGLENEPSEKSKVFKQKPTKKTKRSKTKKFKKGNSKTIKISLDIQEFFRLTFAFMYGAIALSILFFILRK